jgi:zinc transport system substrate-binding protein
MKTISIFLTTFVALVFLQSPAWANEEKPIVLVTIAPLKIFLEKVVGDKVYVEVLIPPASDPHTYNPTPRQVERVSHAQVWFRMGETAERPVLQAVGKRLDTVDVRQGIELIHDPTTRCCPQCGAADLHIWMSARNAEVISKTMADAMIARYPEWQEEIETNLSQWTTELRNLDREIEQILTKRCSSTILASHPDFGYFARDYGLKQLTIEVEGKEPTPQQIAIVLDKARAADVQQVIVEPQRSRRGADRVGAELGIPVVVIDPFAQDWAHNMVRLAQLLSC